MYSGVSRVLPSVENRVYPPLAAADDEGGRHQGETGACVGGGLMGWRTSHLTNPRCEKNDANLSSKCVIIRNDLNIFF